MSFVRPGPARLERNRCPGGIVVHVYAVPSGRLLLVAHLSPNDPIEQLAAADVRATFDALAADEDGVCLVAFDGDSGERSTFGWAPGPIG